MASAPLTTNGAIAGDLRDGTAVGAIYGRAGKEADVAV